MDSLEKETKMTDHETNGVYPMNNTKRHEDDCIGCLEPEYCDCICFTCKQSREKWYSSPEYRQKVHDLMNPTKSETIKEN